MSLCINYTQQYIDGQWQNGHSAKTVTNVNPFNHDEICTIQAASQQDVDSAYQAAQHGFNTWRSTSAENRKALVEKIVHTMTTYREELVEWLIKESGSTRIKANIEVDAALAISSAAANYAFDVNKVVNLNSPRPGQTSQVYRKALGVITVISPWNFPFHLSMRSVIPAIALGNTVVLKPASDTPVTGGLLIARIFELAGAPAGLLNVVVGVSNEIGDYVVEHKTPKLISFTGSTQVGQHVGKTAIASPRLKRLGLELGGNAPLVVLDDADLDLAVNLTVMGRFLHQGQICMSTNRVIVDEKIYEQFIEKLLPAIKAIKSGDPSEPDTIIGPIINQQQVNNIQRIIEKGIADGAQLLIQGEIKGNLITPYVFGNVDPQIALAKEESFGPILPIIKARNEQHALELANDTEYGLSSAVCTKDEQRGLRFALGIEVGMTHINDITVEDSPIAPFGGEKNSGLGRFNDHWIVEEYTATHWITTQK